MWLDQLFDIEADNGWALFKVDLPLNPPLTAAGPAIARDDAALDLGNYIILDSGAISNVSSRVHMLIRIS